MAKKPKINFKDVLLQKGEYLALGIGGIGLLVLFAWGVSTALGAKPPEAAVKSLESEAQRMKQRMNSPEIPAEEQAKIEADLRLSEWKKSVAGGYPYIPSEDFLDPRNTLFDPVGRPDTKWEIPQVLTIRTAQIDLVRAPMKGYDIVYEGDTGNAKIAVLEKKISEKLDIEAMKKASFNLRTRGKDAGKRYSQNIQNMQPPPGPGGAQPGPGGAQPGPGGAMPGPGGAMPGPGSSSSGPGSSSAFGGGTFDQSAQRTETTIKYIPIDELDKAIEAGKPPAQTVIPLRMIIVHCSFPLKEQEEVVRRALRYSAGTDVSDLIHFDGFDVKRRVTMSNGQVMKTKDTDKDGWADYNYEDQYVEKIGAKKFADHFDIDKDDKTGNSNYIPNFLRYEEAMAVPLPKLVEELGKYPPIQLKPILDNIEALKKQGVQKTDPSALAERLQKKSSRKENFMPMNEADTGAGAFSGQGGPATGARPQMPGPGQAAPAIPAPGQPGSGRGNPLDRSQRPGAPSTDPNVAPVTVDHLLIRFVDCDVKPGWSYEYQLRVRMENPVFGEQYMDRLANRSAAIDPANKILFGRWTPLVTEFGSVLYVPEESYLYAADNNEYNKKIDDQYVDAEKKPIPEARLVKERLKAKDNQAVVEVVTWMEQVRTDAGGVREPVGAWVVADMPVGRGEYIGRKTVVQLPLWSSASTSYSIREVPGKIFTPAVTDRIKNPTQPKGWLIDFTADRSVLVDFDGGKVKTVPNSRGVTPPITEEVATELLIVRNDGTMVVRSSSADANDAQRKNLSGVWEKWLSEVQKKMTTGGSGGTTDPFGRPPIPGGGKN